MTNNAVNLGCEPTRLLTYLLTRLEKYFGYTPPPLPSPPPKHTSTSQNGNSLRS